MFTGIISSCKSILHCKKQDGLVIYGIEQPKEWDIQVGESISVNGICSTVTEQDGAEFTVQYMQETLSITTASEWKEQQVVNLERSVTPETLLSGHLVYGHIDSVGTIEEIDQQNDAHIITLSHPKKFDPYIIQKGSIAIDGISLTVINPEPGSFSVAIIPHTYTQSTVHTWSIGDQVNLEYDIIAKYTQQGVS